MKKIFGDSWKNIIYFYKKYKIKYLNLKNQYGGKSRLRLLESYVKDTNEFVNIIEPNLALLLQSYNKPYESRPYKGLYYASDYISLNKYYDIEDFRSLTNDNFWDIFVNKSNNTNLFSYFQSFDYIKPSDALKSFIIGPTFTDCTNVLELTIYHYIYNKVGEKNLMSYLVIY
jgi:hypothetical protein